MLNEYDTDKDGFISLREFIGDVRGDGKTTEMFLRCGIIQYVYCSLPLPNPVFVTFVPPFSFLSDDSPSRWEIEETVRFKDLYDQDKDGKLNREEQLRWVAPNSYGSAREEVNLILITFSRKSHIKMIYIIYIYNKYVFRWYPLAVAWYDCISFLFVIV